MHSMALPTVSRPATKLVEMVLEMSPAHSLIAIVQLAHILIVPMLRLPRASNQFLHLHEYAAVLALSESATTSSRCRKACVSSGPSKASPEFQIQRPSVGFRNVLSMPFLRSLGRASVSDFTSTSIAHQNIAMEHYVGVSDFTSTQHSTPRDLLSRSRV